VEFDRVFLLVTPPEEEEEEDGEEERRKGLTPEEAEERARKVRGLHVTYVPVLEKFTNLLRQ
jgi:hypothetical protein